MHPQPRLIKLLGIICVLTTLDAFAYIEPGPWIIKEMARKIKPQKNQEYSWRGMVQGVEKEANFAAFTLNRDGMQQKSDEDKKGKRIELYFLATFWACHFESMEECQENLFAYLKKANIDVNSIGLGFSDNEPAYIIGARSKDPASSQLWITKNTFLPVKEKRQEDEYSYEKWTIAPSGSLYFPRLMTLRSGKKIIAISMN